MFKFSNSKLLYLIITLVQESFGFMLGCGEGYRLSEGSHRFQFPNCEVTIMAGEGSGCSPIIKCQFEKGAGNADNCVEVSDGLGGRENFCKSFSIYSGLGSDYLFLKSSANPPECAAICAKSKGDFKKSRKLKVTESARIVSENCVCGGKRPGSRPSTRIINGELTDPLEYPWHASHVFYGPNGDKQEAMCGLTIINDRTLLTAAHCWGNELKWPPMAEIWLKVDDMERLGEDGTSANVTIERIIPHPFYDYYDPSRQNQMFDIAIIKLRDPIDFASDKGLTGTVCLENGRGRDWLGGVGEALGRGSVSLDGKVENFLKRANLAVEPQDHCPHSFQQQQETIKYICTLNVTGTPCSGDSGGPFSMLDEVTGRWTQIGITSFTIGLCDQGKTMYIRVSEFLPWIFYHSRDGVWCSE